MSIWEKLGFGGYKGFSHESDQLLRSAVELAGNLGCEKADTGHLLLAILQQDHGAAARFLEGKQIREPEVRRQLAESRRAPALHLDRYALAPDLKRTMDYAIIGAQNAHLNRAEPEHLLCAMLEDDGCTAGILLASKLYKKYIEKYNIKDVVVGSIFTNYISEETVHFSNKNELFYTKNSDEDMIISELSKITNVYKRSSEVMYKYNVSNHIEKVKNEVAKLLEGDNSGHGL